MAADTTVTTLPPLVASLLEEGKKAGVNYNFSDPAFIRKVEALSRQVPREFDITLSFRAFCADHNRGVTPFWFPERFDKYLRLARQPGKLDKPAEPAMTKCPQCGALNLPGSSTCGYCQEEHSGLEVLRKHAERGDAWARHLLAEYGEHAHA